ncbi:hypothetical protein [Rathayibacter rathayi]|uniref:hypothetical protein n=1 Tax=Rathayibacter rathayi TaxID=33887 RepID=UPI0011B0DC77|nr:hypothetical protein [Rathayibacter rathayi]
MASHRRGVLALAVCVAATTVLTAAASYPDSRPPAAPADTSDALVAALGTGSVENQRLLGALKSWILAQPDVDSSGYIDQVNDAENGSVRLLWSGQSPLRAAAVNRAAELGIDAVIEERPYSLARIDEIASAVLEHADDITAAGFTVSSVVGVQADTAGIQVEGDFVRGPVNDQARDSLLESVKTVVAGVAGVALDVLPGHSASTAGGTRADSTAPFFAGSYIQMQASESTCSTGFSMRVNGVDHATTARHCDPRGDVFRARDGKAIVGSGLVTSRDGAMTVLTGPGTGRTFDGAWNDAKGYNKRVHNRYDVGLNDRVCTSGGNSGVHCGIKVTATAVYADDGSGRFSNVRGEQQNSGAIAAIQGDSGGPVFVPYGGALNGYVGAVGMIQFVQDASTKGCGSVHDSGGKCSRTVLFSTIETIERRGEIGATLVTE